MNSMCCGAVREYFYLVFPIQETASLELSWGNLVGLGYEC